VTSAGIVNAWGSPTMSKLRVAIGSLTLSAAALVGLAVKEGYTDQAVIPVKGDVPTVGFGSTTRADGSPVKMGDRTTPVQALQRTLAYTQQAEAGFKHCVRAPLHQAEFDLYLDFSYQFGMGWTCRSIAPLLNAGDYVGACNKLLEFRRVNGFDCSTPGNRVCAGVWTRQLERHAKCMAAQ